MLEPVQGEAGVIPATREFMKALRDLTKEQGLLLIADEVQSGFGRRPAVELYDLKADADCVKNLATSPTTEKTRASLQAALYAELKAQDDPRMSGHGDVFAIHGGHAQLDQPVLARYRGIGELDEAALAAPDHAASHGKLELAAGIRTLEHDQTGQ